MTDKPWTAQRANMEGWSVTASVVWEENRIVEKTTTIRAGSTSVFDSNAEAHDHVRREADAGSEYHQRALAMCGVEKMGWTQIDDGSWQRTSRTFTGLDGVAVDLPL